MNLLQLFYTTKDIADIGLTLHMDTNRNHPIVQAQELRQIKILIKGVAFRHIYLPIDNKTHIIMHNIYNDSDDIFNTKRIC